MIQSRLPLPLPGQGRTADRSAEARYSTVALQRWDAGPEAQLPGGLARVRQTVPA